MNSAHPDFSFSQSGDNAGDNVILVDEHDREIGIEAKMPAHLTGKLHRAFSIFVFAADGRVMLQQRAFSKYHSGGLWTNTCCSHPRPGETISVAAHRRLYEEMGFDCELKSAFSFIYRAELDKGLTEHELDHVLIGSFNGEPKINTLEAAAWRWADPIEVDRDLGNDPGKYTVWFRIAWRELRSRI